MKRLVFVLVGALMACHGEAQDTQSITGSITVTGAAPGALAGFAVTLLPAQSSTSGIASATTDASGGFVFPAIAPGKYVAQISLPQTTEGSRAVDITVEKAPIALPAFAFSGLGSITGHVAAASGATPIATIFTGGQASAQSDANGAFTIANVPTGSQLVVATAPGFAAAISQPVEVKWRGNSNVDLLELRIAASTQILNGRVSWPGPPPQKVPPIQVVVDEGKWTSTADEDGFFSIPGVTDGAHALDFFEMTTPQSGEPVPLHNRLSRVFVSSGQTFVIGTTLTPLPTIPLFRGRIATNRVDVTWSNDERWYLVQGPQPLLMHRNGTRVSLVPGSVCSHVTGGALCSWNTDPSRPLAQLTFVSYAGVQVVLSDRVSWRLIPYPGDKILIAEPGALADSTVVKLVDFNGASVTLPLEIEVPGIVQFSPSGKRLVTRATYNSGDLRVYDVASGELIAADACAGALFYGERVFCTTTQGQLMELVQLGNNAKVGTGLGGLQAASPDGKFVSTFSSWWGEGTQTIARTSDGGTVWSGLGAVTFAWSADGKKAWGFVSHEDPVNGHPEDNGLVEIDLTSGALRAVALADRCVGNAASPSVWICQAGDETFAIDASTNSRKTVTHGFTSEWVPPRVRWVADGIVVATNDELWHVALPTIDVTSIAMKATIDGSNTSTNEFADTTGRRVVYRYDNGTMLRVVDRTAQKEHWLGFVGTPLYYFELRFLETNTLATLRPAPSNALIDLAGLYMTEFAP